MNARPADYSRNLSTGLAVLVFLGLGLLALAGWQSWRAVEEENPRYVAYFENAGGLSEGDPVLLKGKRIGRVATSELVQREGRTVVRVEFEIDREWVEENPFPRESVASVVFPGLLSSARLSLSYPEEGSNEVVLPGDTFENTRSAPEDGAASGLVDSLVGIAEGMRSLSAILDDDERMTSLRDAAFRIDELTSGWRAQAEEGVPAAIEGVRSFGEAGDDLAEARANLAAERPSILERLASLAGSLRSSDQGLAEARGNLADLRRDLEAAEAQSAKAAEESEAESVRGAFLQLRRWTAEIAASMDMAAADPGRAGDGAPARRAAGHFNGGRTALEKIDRTEAEARGEPGR